MPSRLSIASASRSFRRSQSSSNLNATASSAATATGPHSGQWQVRPRCPSPQTYARCW